MITKGMIAAAVVLGTLCVARSIATANPVGQADTVEYGRRLLNETAKLIGPDQPNPALRYTGSHLACASCHIDGGAQPGTLSLLTTASHYPRPSGRDGGVRDLRDRINGCMLRSMNGRALPRDSTEMIAMETYIQHLGMSNTTSVPVLAEPSPFAEPARAANPQAGQTVYTSRCALCHGADGLGLHVTTQPSDGYVFPPLWGPDSFNDGAGMNRVLTAAMFIKARMPLGSPTLTDEQAFDVAAYINSKPRPAMRGLERDYPDLSTKPVDNPYPPYLDPFTKLRHKYGPFEEIRAWYAAHKTQPAGKP